MDPLEFRRALGHFTTGVTVVTTRHTDGVHGATVNSFTAVSLDPPLVLVCLDRRSKACEYLRDQPFAINVLHSGQRELAMHFAGKPAEHQPSWSEVDSVPTLDGCLAQFVCAPWANYDGGDHVMFLGEVRTCHTRKGEPLVFTMGSLRELGEELEELSWLGSLDCPVDPGWGTRQETLRRLS